MDQPALDRWWQQNAFLLQVAKHPVNHRMGRAWPVRWPPHSETPVRRSEGHDEHFPGAPRCSIRRTTVNNSGAVMAATGLVSHPGEDIPLQPAEDPAGVTLGPVGRMLDEPFPGHQLRNCWPTIAFLQPSALCGAHWDRSLWPTAGGPPHAAGGLLLETRRDRRPGRSVSPCLPKRYFNRHHLPPLGDISRYRPPPSNIFLVLLPDLA